MKRIALLGSTGSIGVNTLDVVARSPDRFQVSALSAGSNVDLLARQIRQFKPEVVGLYDSSRVEALRERVRGIPVEIVTGDAGLMQVATHPEADLVVTAIVGSAGLVPTLAAIRAGKNLAIANKETLVVAGELVLREAAGKGSLIPIDSEHSAIFQALNGEKHEAIRRIVLTGSGGPFRTFSREQMEQVTVAQALQHPTWTMGHKITIDSATMMNKGLEYIEAKWLFGRDVAVEIVVHPQSIIHSMIEFVDTSIIAQMGFPDMRVPIAYALSYPQRLEMELPSLDLAALSRLTFESPDYEKFPCLQLAVDAMEEGKTLPAVLNAANEVAVQAYLNEQIPFKDISEIIRITLNHHKPVPVERLDDVLEADRWAREEARKRVAVAH
ncbi:MAG: 1-deoxy-D-xylulose-5-phosphate reductoisomerase [Nitrospinaceae bacterium]|nr:1-deoxy-D-xylulose-5-phosphate reductoisomerase [Nitrospinaceae bacterium]NIR56735.1 1-deoxy-D-xylulose-5-phosphate reductoisomerase [Nitrospinaceae bacterium]NIS87184.1 1-deoxy-D-xylulose-5-phosphate reductoisomerase [Nitrospinaceae bacterium]NIT84053.1 1-deoxy-D-xylulose-5-phosphate reductoisomerase [Nitrospinaceae bacterium]NIU46236.1 1-deoxy-D-xylulose-5-phosphate reductoisomerase [Nitrospinaceae bacterium]